MSTTEPNTPDPSEPQLSLGVIVWSEDPRQEPTVIADRDPVALARKVALTIHEEISDPYAFAGATEFLEKVPPPQDWVSPTEVDVWLGVLQETAPYPAYSFHQIPISGGVDGTNAPAVNRLLPQSVTTTSNPEPIEQRSTSVPEQARPGDTTSSPERSRSSEVPHPSWEAFEDSGIPEIVVRMFPPEPARQDHLRPDGTLDEESLEDAYEDWRSDCIGLAFEAAKLPELLDRLARLENEQAQAQAARATEAERVRDGIIDLLARDPLPSEPLKEDYLVTVAPAYEGEYENMRYSWDHTQWRADFTAAARRHDHVLRELLAEGGPRTGYLPEHFRQDWLPADLVALHTLRTIVNVDHPELGVPMEREQVRMLERLIMASDPEVRVIDPDDPDGRELFDGQASDAHEWLQPGVYHATSIDGAGEFRVVVGRVPGNNGDTASAAFPPVEHDSAVLGEIALILELETRHNDPSTMLARINAAVESTGRLAAQPADLGREAPSTRLEQGALLSELLAEREQQLNTPPDASEPGAPGRRPERDL